MKRKYRFCLYGLSSISLFLIILSIWNVVCSKKESSVLDKVYGRNVFVHDKKMNVNILGKENKRSLVILPGLGSASPVLEFMPFAQDLSKYFKVITIEPFGYGLSDETDTQRNISTIVEELHTCVYNLGEKQYYLMGYAEGGLYSLYWANAYESEVLGFIGIDSSVPHQNEYSPYQVSMESLNLVSARLSRLVSKLGLYRLFSINDKETLLLKDSSFPYTKQEIDIFRWLTLDKSYNKTVMNEYEILGSNIQATETLSFPDFIPVLNFVCTKNCQLIPEWEKLHKDVIKETRMSWVKVLNGDQYLHLTKRPELIETIEDWLKMETFEVYNQI